jgi:Ca2+-binding RTX toxin-like protein
VYVTSNYVLPGFSSIESIIVGPGTNAVNVTTNGFGVFVDGNDGVNTVIGGAGDDYFFGNGGADDLYGLGGADSLVGDDGDDYLSGGDGNDSLAGRAGADTLLGGSGDDSYVADLSDLVVEYAGGGVDSLTIATSYALGAGNEIEFVSTDDSDGTDAINFTGNEIGNTLTGNAGVNSLYGLDGNDNLIGGGGNDYLSGGDGDDQLTGGTGADTLLGGLGDDTYFAEESDLVVEYAGGGIDAIFASSNFVLAAGNEIEFLAATGFGGTENMNLSGNEFNNAITGNEGNNRLFGGMGEDTLTGNGGADVFEFGGAIGLGHVDTITDFVSIDDLMLLDSRVFTGMTAGLLNADAFLSGAGVTAATNAAHRIIHDTTTGKLYFDADGDGAGAAVEFAIIGADTPVFSTDFYVF